MSLLDQQLEERYRLTFEHAHIGIAVAGPDGRFVRVNRRFCEIVGYDASELLGRTYISVSHPDDAEMSRERFQSLVTGEAKFTSFDRRLLRKDGTVLWVHVTLSAATDDSGGLVGVIGVVEDITEHRAAAEQIRFQSTLLGSVKQAVAATDTLGRITYWNPYAEQLFEWPAPEALGKNILEVVVMTGKDNVAAALFDRLGRGESWTGEFEVQNRSGHAFSILFSGAPIRDSEGAQIGVVSVAQDLTDLKWREAEMQRRASQQAALAQLGQIALGNASIGFLLSQAAEIVRDVLAIASCEVYKRRDDGMVVVAAAFANKDIAAGADDYSQAAYTTETNAPVVCNYLATETRFAPSRRLMTHGVISSVTVPIDGGVEGPWGVLGAFSRSAHDFAASEVDFLRALAMTLGQAIERRRAEVELQVRAVQQSAIAELGRRTATDLGPETLNRTCELVMDGLSVEYSTFLQLVDDGSTLSVRAGSDWMPDQPHVIPVVGTQAGHTFRDSMPVIVRDYFAERRFASSAFVQHGIRAGLTVPVATQHRKFGVLTAYTRVAKEFTGGDMQFLQSVANLLAEALEHDAAERALIQSEQRFRGVIEGASDIIFTVASSGTITSLNPRFEAVTGWRPDEWVGRSFSGLLFPDERASMQEVFESLLAGRGHVRVETRLLGKDGRVILIESAASARVGEGRVEEVVGFARDITDERRLEDERRRLEAQLDQSSRLSSLGRLAATVAHEFNNVLMGIAPFADVLRREVSTERGVTAVDQISRAVKRGKRITQDILRFTQPAQPVLTALDTEAWLSSLVLETRTVVGTSHSIHSTIGPGDLRVLGDANQLHQSFTNLILNARDAMPDGGRITISACRENARATFSFGGVDSPEKYVHFTVEDTGIGIPPATLQQVFDPLFTTKRNGTGLGLSVTSNVVTRHKGEIFVESTVGVGTKFHLFLPIAGEAASQDWSADEPAATARGGLRRVLLVEDDVTVAVGLSALLESEGIGVQVVHNGADVMPALERSRPDAVILDIGLPDIDGTVVYASIAESYPDLPVVFSSGHADEKKVAASLEVHVAFLHKPYDHETLFATLRRVTGAST
ncbi:MAG TPA: PAS domain S-box protein [Thermoanaerobaculia bacterium]|nr:PAS domain S-box protein [Thermoanaerobaculia bacterium]